MATLTKLLINVSSRSKMVCLRQDNRLAPGLVRLTLYVRKDLVQCAMYVVRGPRGPKSDKQ